MSRRQLLLRGKANSKKARLIRDSILGIISDLTEGHGTDFVPLAIYDTQQKLKFGYDLFLTYAQTGYYMRKLVDEGALEKEIYNTDRTARHWSDQVSRYRFPI